MTTMIRIRAWQGPAIFSYGFRPFFFGGAVLAALLIALWLPWFLGLISLPSAFPPVAWHAHELLFGYVPAIIAGFMLTAVPNWTGRLPIVGPPLAGLFGVWLLGRIAMAGSVYLPPLALAILTLAFPLLFAAAIAREILAGQNWRNAKMLVGIGLIACAQALFHYEVWRFGHPVHGDRLAIAATLMMIMLVGGRIVPSFTRNWIKRQNPGREPAVFDRFDASCMIIGGLALLLWVALPACPGSAPVAAGVLVAAGALHLVRLARWMPHRALAEPLVSVLHLGYFFIPLGFLLAGSGAATRFPGLGTAAIHAWTIGAIGLMTLAVMTRATRGHTGRPLIAPPGTVLIYAAILIAVTARIGAALMPEYAPMLLPIAAAGWVGGFLGFTLGYGRMLLTRAG